ncbi:ParB N-terminal domain-containing protein [Thalassobaculum sp.]|uniref:ParB/RepB/Spo0J family partition protein n=1 Tax=Thalassobaculum sp. TaxID=2022740 RepID=UPI0032EB2435
MTIEYMSLKTLSIAPENMRKTAAESDLGELIASISAEGLLQNLVGYRDGDDTVAITAGGRRLRALNALAADKSSKAFRATMKIPVDIRDRAELHPEISLAENVHRLATHPMDEFEAFARLVEAGRSAEEVAARFGTTVRHVEGRLALGRLCDEVREAYRAGDITLDVAKAFTLSSSHEAQRSALATLRNTHSYGRTSRVVREMLITDQLPPHNRLVQYVGIEAYLAAGGSVTRDLFSSTDQEVAALTDGALVQKLATDKLAQDARALADEGWKWIETSLQPVDHAQLARYTRLHPRPMPLSDAAAAELAMLTEALEALRAEWAATAEGASDDDAEAVAKVEAFEQREAELEGAIDAIEQCQVGYPVPERARAGVVVSVDYAGDLVAVRGLVRPEDDGAVETTGRTPVTTDGRDSPERAAEKAAGYTLALQQDLAAYRQQVLKAAVATAPEVALDLVIYTMVTALVSRVGYRRSPFGASFTQTYERVELKDLDSTAAAAELDRIEAGIPFLVELPKDPVALFDAVRALEPDAKGALLAWCVSKCLTVGLPTAQGTAQRIVERIGSILKVDVAAWWRPTRARYFERVKKDHLLEILGDCGLDAVARQVAKEKKPAIVNGVAAVFDPSTRPTVLTEAQSLALDTWLPPGMAFGPAASEAETGAEGESPVPEEPVAAVAAE